MAVGKTTGFCNRCGVRATHVWVSRSAITPLELCDKHSVEHREAIAKGEWKAAE